MRVSKSVQTELESANAYIKFVRSDDEPRGTFLMSNCGEIAEYRLTASRRDIIRFARHILEICQEEINCEEEEDDTDQDN